MSHLPLLYRLFDPHLLLLYVQTYLLVGEEALVLAPCQHFLLLHPVLYDLLSVFLFLELHLVEVPLLFLQLSLFL